MAKAYNTTAKTPEEIKIAVDDLLSKMTLEEKLGQMTQSPGANVEAIGGEIVQDPLEELIKEGKIGSQIIITHVDKMIPLVREHQRIAVEESRLGIPMLFCQDVIHGYQTVFPIPLGWSCSWNPELIEKSQQVAAKEASCVGINVAFSPMVDVGHDARWGRVLETHGEDPYLDSKLAFGHVRGLQGKSLYDKDTIAACVKHYIGYAAGDAGREYNTTEFSETAMRNLYLPGFKGALDAGVATVMNSFNLINGIPSVANKYIQDDVLRKELGFNGVLISDYSAVDELKVHGVAADDADCADLAVNATLDIEMSSTNILDNAKKLIEDGRITQQQIDDAVRRILTLKYELGLMEDPYRYIRENDKKKIFCQENLDVARELGRRSIVLLKNKGVLPLKKAKVGLFGPIANSKDLGGAWQFTDMKDQFVTIEEGLKAKGFDVVVEKGSDVLEPIEGGIEAAIKAAEGVDVIVLCVGESSPMAGEASSRMNITVPKPQMKLAKALKATGKPIVAVITSGRPLILKWFEENVDAIVETWFLGSQAGNAIADVLVGDYNPSGRLTMTFPLHPGQVPIYYNHYNTGRPLLDPKDPQKFLSRYLDGPNEPLYNFGYGLSYTTFEYSDLELSGKQIKRGDVLKVKATVKNTGVVEGEETAQIYIHDVAAQICRPVLELKGFKKIVLKPGESAVVEFELDEKSLSFYGRENKLICEQGKFEVYVGPYANNKVLLKDEFVLE